MENKHKKFDLKADEGKLSLSIDSNQDGEKLASLSIGLSEAVQEAFAREKQVEGAKLVDFRFEGSELILKVDTDQDGEHVMDLRLNLSEALDEGADAFLKK